MKTTGLLISIGLLAASALPVYSQTTAAHLAALKFMRGVSFGNSLEYAPGHPAGGLVYNDSDFAVARSEGFDHIRVPVAWHLYAGPGPAYTISNSIFTRVDFMVTNAQARGLAVIVDEHHFDDLTTSPSVNTAKYYAIWKQIAAHYASRPDTLAFELLNEPKDAATTAVMNPIYAEAIRQVRLTNQTRTIFVGPGQYNSVDQLASLQLPSNELNIIVTVHSYDPYYFTHQGAEWALPDTGTRGVLFPGPPLTPLTPAPGITHQWVLDWFRSYNTLPVSQNPSSASIIRAKLTIARNWASSNNRPVHVGEFGCYQKFTDTTSRLNYYRTARSVMDEFGLGWAMWDWKAGFHYILNGRPDPLALRTAMFPDLQLVTPAGGTIKFTAAKGKTYVVERTTALTPIIQWQSISTQTLSTTQFLFTDPDASRQAGGYYRVRWIK